MTSPNQRETLVCIGGPLHAKRLSVPTGLRWFALSGDALDIEHLVDSETGVVAIENIEAVGEYGLADAMEAGEPPKSPVYVRRQFVTGESGLIHVFSFRKD